MKIIKWFLIVSFFLSFVVASFIGGLVASSYLENQNSRREIQPIESDKLFSVVNDWRIKSGLKPFIKEKTVCDIAKIRIYDRKGKITHGGFKEVHEKYLPNSHLGENLITNAYGEQTALTTWLQSASHAANLKGDYKYSCIANIGDSAVQIFADF